MKIAHTALRSLCALSVAATTGAACDAELDAPAPVAVSVLALEGGTCGSDPATANPFADASRVSIRVSGIKGDDEPFTIRDSANLRAGSDITISGIPVGVGHTVELWAQGGQSNWYGRATGVAVRRSEKNPIEMTLTRHGAFTDVGLPEAFNNMVFPAAVELGDGRVMVSGGFRRVISDASGTFLGSPSDQAVIYDPRTGATSAVLQMPAGQERGAHAMAFIPATNQVLIVGGALRIGLDDAKAFPYVFDVADGRNDLVLFDVASNTFSVVENDSESKRTQLKRAFPRVHAMNDGTVVITGGGRWPVESSEDYKIVAVYDAALGKLRNSVGFQSFFPRSGHSMTFLKNEENLAQLLLLGGTTNESGRRQAEILKQSSRQTDGIDGNFVQVDVAGELPFLFFHEVTPLSGQRFLVTGGVRADAKRALQAPLDDEAWLLSYSEDSGTPTLSSIQVPGLGAGRVFHSALTGDFLRANVVGGLSGRTALDNDKVKFFDVTAYDSGAAPWTVAPETSAFVSRGGHAGVMQLSGSIFLVGGETNLTPNTPECAFSQVYTPSSIAIPK